MVNITLQDNGSEYVLKRDDGTVLARYDVNNDFYVSGADFDRFNAATVIQSTDDLPEVENGRHQLEDGMTYWFDEIVVSQYGLELGQNNRFYGWHGSQSGFICTGGGPALYGDGVPFFADNFYAHAPGGTVFDLTADIDTEFLVNGCAFSDAAGLGNIASLGTIDGFRVPSFKECNFEDFDDGITFNGTCDKVFFAETPFRTVTSSNVTVLTFGSDFNCEIVDMTDNYVKDVQSDTQVIDVDPSATISEVFQYRGTTHDPSVTPDNILNGAASVSAIGYRVDGSYPLSDSTVVGELTLDGSFTIPINSAGTYYQISGPTISGNEDERISSSSGQMTYEGKKAIKPRIQASLTLDAGNKEFRVAIAKNGVPQQTTEMWGIGRGSGSPISIQTSGIEKLETGDTVSVHIQNTGGTGDLTALAMNMNLQG